MSEIALLKSTKWKINEQFFLHIFSPVSPHYGGCPNDLKKQKIRDDHTIEVLMNGFSYSYSHPYIQSNPLNLKSDKIKAN